MLASIEEFSFPTENLASNSSIDSPPLWRSSPAASSPNNTVYFGKEEEEEEEERERHGEISSRVYGTAKRVDITQRSFSCIQTGGRKTAKSGGFGGGDGEERMDLLWENFNEESARNRSSRFDDSGRYSHGDDRQIVEIGCVQALKKPRNRSNNSNNNNNNTKPAMVMVLKVLKKLFLTHSNAHHIHHHNHHRHHVNKLRASRAW